MKFTDWLSSVVFFVYFSVVVLMIVNGQPTTTDDDIEGVDNRMSKLISKVATLEQLLVAAVDKFEKLEG